MKRALVLACLSPALSISAFAAVSFTNGDFEANGGAYLVWPGYSGSVGVNNGVTNPASPTGWTVTGGTGLNNDTVIATDSIAGTAGIGGPNNPFIDNGAENGTVLLLQGVASVSQDVSGFIIGNPYTLTFEVNARNCCGDVPQGQLSIDGNIAIPFTTVPPVGGTNAYNFISVPFVAPDTTLTFLVESRASAGGDATLLLDNFTIVPEPSAVGLLGAAALFAFRRRR